MSLKNHIKWIKEKKWIKYSDIYSFSMVIGIRNFNKLKIITVVRQWWKKNYFQSYWSNVKPTLYYYYFHFVSLVDRKFRIKSPRCNRISLSNCVESKIIIIIYEWRGERGVNKMVHSAAFRLGGPHTFNDHARSTNNNNRHQTLMSTR